MASDGSELPGTSIRRTTASDVGFQAVAINLSMRRPAAVASEEAEAIEVDDGDAAANAEVAAINDGSNTSRRHAGASLPVSVPIELQSNSSSGDEDECVFVLELKPPHLRTPEQVSLDSNSDSDSVLVNEQIEAAPPPRVDNQATQSPVVPASRDQGLFVGPSTSGAAANRGKNWKLIMAQARRLDQLRTLRPTRLKRSSMPARSDSGSSNNSSSSNSSCSSSSSDEDSGASSTTNSEPPKNKSRKPVPKKKRSKKVSNGKRTECTRPECRAGTEPRAAGNAGAAETSGTAAEEPSETPAETGKQP